VVSVTGVHSEATMHLCLKLAIPLAVQYFYMPRSVQLCIALVADLVRHASSCSLCIKVGPNGFDELFCISPSRLMLFRNSSNSLLIVFV